MNQVFYFLKAFCIIVRRKVLSGGYGKYARILVVIDPEEVYILDFAGAIPFYTVNYPLHYTSGEKLPPYLRLPKKAIAYSIAIKVGK